MEKIDDFLLGILRDHFITESEESAGISSNSGAASNFLLKTEETIISFLNSNDRLELEFPPLNSYYRRILHRLCRRYNLAHRVEATNIFNAASTLRKVYLTKPIGEDLLIAAPLLKCCEWIEAAVEFDSEIKFTGQKIVSRKSTDKSSAVKIKTSAATEPQAQPKPKFKILRRQAADEKSSPGPVPFGADAGMAPSSANGLTLEEREANYQAVRERIFEGFNGQLPVESLQSSQQSEPPADMDPQSNVQCEGLIVDPQSNVQCDSRIVDPQPHPPLLSPLNPDAIPFDFSLAARTDAIDHIYQVTSTSALPLSRETLNQLLSECPPSSAVIRSRSVPTDFCFLLVKTSEVKAVPSGPHWLIQKWEPEFYLD